MPGFVDLFIAYCTPPNQAWVQPDSGIYNIDQLLHQKVHDINFKLLSTTMQSVPATLLEESRVARARIYVLICCPSRAPLVQRVSDSTMASTAWAAAILKGLPPNVPPRPPGCAASKIAERPVTADSGKP